MTTERFRCAWCSAKHVASDHAWVQGRWLHFEPRTSTTLKVSTLHFYPLCTLSSPYLPDTISLLLASSLLWNSLPSPLRSASSESSLHSFRQHLQKYIRFPVIRPVGFLIKQTNLMVMILFKGFLKGAKPWSRGSPS